MAIWNTSEGMGELREELSDKVKDLHGEIARNLNLTFINSRQIKELSDAMKGLVKRIVLLEEEKSGLSERLFDLVEESSKDIIE